MRVSPFLILGASTAAAFVPNAPAFHKKQYSVTQLEAAPTMVVYWSIKTAFDTLMYAAGQTDEVKGTGVFSSFELKREKEEDAKDDKQNDKKEEKGK